MAEQGTKVAEAYVRIAADEGPLNKALGGLKGHLSNYFGNLAAVLFGTLGAQLVNAAGRFAADIGNAMIGGNAQFEQFETQFAVLLGSTELAKQRMAELAEFARDTPFELPGVVQASKVLQVLGGSALATGKQLTLVGDLAAATGEPFNEIALHVGRIYAGLKNGVPFGVSSLRLAELGIISGKTQRQLEKAAESGKDFTSSWKVFTDSVGKFEGMMDKLSVTMVGTWSNLKDTFGQIMREVGKPFFDQVKIGLGGVLKFFEQDSTKNAITKFTKSVKINLQLFVNDMIIKFNEAKQLIADFGGVRGIWDGFREGVGIVTNIAASFFSVQVALPAVISLVGMLTKGLIAAGVAMAANPLGLLITGLKLLAVRIASSHMTLENLSKAWDYVSNAASTAFGVIDKWIDDNKETFISWWDTISEIALNVQGAIGQLFTSLAGLWDSTLGPVFGKLENALGNAWEWVKRFVSSTLDLFGFLTTDVGLSWSLLRDSIALKMSQLVDVMKGVWQTIKADFFGVAAGLGGAFKELFFKLIDTIYDFSKRAFAIAIQAAHIARVIAREGILMDSAKMTNAINTGERIGKTEADKLFTRDNASTRGVGQAFAEDFKTEFDKHFTGVVESDATRLLKKNIEETGKEIGRIREAAREGRKEAEKAAEARSATLTFSAPIDPIEAQKEQMAKEAAMADAQRDIENKRGGKFEAVDAFYKQLQSAALKRDDNSTMKDVAKSARETAKNTKKLVEKENQPATLG